MRTPEELKERIRMALVEDMNNIQEVLKEPENQFPQFLERITTHLHEIMLDEIAFKRKW
jgi:hypothetical protein